jgi:hypothetical protein
MARTKVLKEEEKNEVNIALIAKDIEYIKGDVKEIKDKMEKNYITREEFDPIKKIVYGIVTLVLSGVVVAILALVIKK